MMSITLWSASFSSSVLFSPSLLKMPSTRSPIASTISAVRRVLISVMKNLPGEPSKLVNLSSPLPFVSVARLVSALRLIVDESAASLPKSKIEMLVAWPSSPPPTRPPIRLLISASMSRNESRSSLISRFTSLARTGSTISRILVTGEIRFLTAIEKLHVFLPFSPLKR